MCSSFLQGEHVRKKSEGSNETNSLITVEATEKCVRDNRQQSGGEWAEHVLEVENVLRLRYLEVSAPTNCSNEIGSSFKMDANNILRLTSVSLDANIGPSYHIKPSKTVKVPVLLCNLDMVFDLFLL